MITGGIIARFWGRRAPALREVRRRIAHIAIVAVVAVVATSGTAMPGSTPARAASSSRAVAMDAAGTRIVFIDSSGQVMNYWESGDFWYGPAAIGGTARADSPIAIDSSGNYVAFIDASGNVVNDWRNASTGAWSGPAELGGTARARSPLALSGDDSHAVFVDASGNVVNDWRTSSGTWTGPSAIGGQARSDSPITINDNASLVAFIDTSGYVTNDYASSGAWAGPSRLGGQARAGSALAASDSGDIVAFIDASGNVVNDWRNASTGAWSGPAELGGTAEAGSPLALDGSPDRAYFVDASGNVVNDWRTSSGTWTGPSSIGGTAEAGSGIATGDSSQGAVAFYDPSAAGNSSGMAVDWTTGGNWAGPGDPDLITTNLKGVNWAVGDSARGNYFNGPLYVTGLDPSSSYATAESTAESIVSGMYSATGGNTVRMPINEATVNSSYWSVYTGAIDGALAEGNVILCYWANANGEPANMTAYWQMWATVTAKYGSNRNVFFEPLNEPFGYTGSTALATAQNLVNNLYAPWLSRYSSVRRAQVILDGTGYADNVSQLGGLVSGTRLAVHDYCWYNDNSSCTLAKSESQWATQLGNEMGSYAARTIVTEWGDSTASSKNFDNSSSTAVDIDYVRGVTDEMRALGNGSTFWTGVAVQTGYTMFTVPGGTFNSTGNYTPVTSTTLTLQNQSALDRLRYGWGR